MIRNNHLLGFTLIEIIVTMAILGILLTLGQGAYSVWQKMVHINNAAEELKSVLVQTQQKAAASADAKSWGVHFEADRYIIFSGDLYDPADTANKIKSLVGLTIINPDTSLSDGASGYSPDAVFAKFTGQTVNSGAITLSVISDLTVTRSITISKLGVIQ
ncbi:MAG: type II secretion system protein [Candidatus Komeilibacteria bacterium]